MSDTPTPPPYDKDLDDIICHIGHCWYGDPRCTKKFYTINEAKAALQAVILRAQIDALRQTIAAFRATDSDTKKWLDLENRITALQQQLKQLEKDM